MGQVRAVTQRSIAATAAQVLDALGDYKAVRPQVLPAQYTDYTLVEGGSGAGTIASWRLHATEKRVRDVRATVTAPAPGTLVETDANSSLVITWTVEPEGADASRATVEAVWTGATGIGGFFERTFAPKGMNRIHDELLAKLAAHVESR